MTTLPFTKPNVRAEAFELIKERSFQKGEFTLASGKKSDFYLDMKPSLLDPKGITLLSELVFNRVKQLNPDYIGGLELGAVPLITPVAMRSFEHGMSIPGFVVRKEVKDHGTKKLIEGVGDGELQGKRVVVIDDVTTSGGSAMEAVKAVQKVGAEVILVLAIVDREEGAVEFYKDKGIDFDSLFWVSELMADN